MKNHVLTVAFILLLAPTACSQQVAYEVSFPNRAHHEAEVSATFSGVPAGETLEIRMSRTSPGRYALHEFAKNVHDVHAYDSAGRELEIGRPNPHQWDLDGHDGTVRITYTLFADRADGTYSGFNTRYAHMNMPATFMWARGMQDAPVSIRFEIPDDECDVATQLYPTDQRGVFTAPDFWYFIDSPTHIGQIVWRTWKVEEDAGTYTMHPS